MDARIETGRLFHAHSPYGLRHGDVQGR
jgi:hypothetical protein